MRVFVAGASGAIGHPLVPRLVAAGHDVTGTTRSQRSAEAIRAAGARAAIVDALDAAPLHEAVERAAPEVVVHELTALPERFNPRKRDLYDATNRIRREAPATCSTRPRLPERGASSARASRSRTPRPPSPWSWTRRRRSTWTLRRRSRRARRLQRRRRRAGRPARLGAGLRGGDRRAAAAPGAGLAGAAGGRQDGELHERAARRLQREGQAGARLAATLEQLARGLPGRAALAVLADRHEEARPAREHQRDPDPHDHLQLRQMAERSEHHARAEQDERGGQQRVQVVQGRESILVGG